MLIDTHCHLNFEAFKNDLPQVISRARERGVSRIIIPGTDLASSRRAVEIAREYPGCYAAIGIHPHHAKDPNLKVDNNLRNELEELLIGEGPSFAPLSGASAGKIVAVGEIGLDYHVYSKSKKYTDVKITPEYKKKQTELFLLQYTLAQEHKLPTIMHCRDAYDDMIQTISPFEIEANIVKNNSRKRETFTSYVGEQESNQKSSVKSSATSLPLPKKFPPGVFHCFGGSKQNLRVLISMGYYIGFDGNITYSLDWKLFVSSTPLDRLLLETDAPFLAPVPHRGKQNEPSYLPLVAAAVAAYQGVSIEEITNASTENAKKLFRLS